MIQDDYRAAIDIGTTKVCTILGRKRSDGSIEIAGVGVAPCNGLHRGLVTDPKATTAAVLESIGSASKAAGMPIRRAYIGLTGSHVESRNIWSRVDSKSGVKVVAEEDMRRAISVASADAQTEGRSILHVIPRSYALDGIYGVRNPLGMHAAEMYIQTHAILGDQHPIDSLTAAVKAAGIGVSGLIVEPIASAEAVLTEQEREEGVILIDVGGGTSDIAVFHEGSIVHTAVLSVGGYQFTNDLAVSFDIPHKEAEEVKLKYGSAAQDARTATEEVEINPRGMDEPLLINRREIGQLMNDRGMEMLRLLMKKINEPHVTELDITRMVLTGGGVKLDGFASLARYVFQHEVRVASPRGAEGLPEVNQDPQFAAGVGILLWGMRNLPRESHISSKSHIAVSSGPLAGSGLRSSFRKMLPRKLAGSRESGTPVGV